MNRMTVLVFPLLLAGLATAALDLAPADAADHRCLRVAVLTIQPHDLATEDGQAAMGGWFPLICRHGAKFAKTGRPVDVDISGKALASRNDFTEICGQNLELADKVSRWILDDIRLTDDAPTHDEDRVCLALHPVGIYCGVRANMAEVMSFRAMKGEIPIAVNEDHCPDR